VLPRGNRLTSKRDFERVKQKGTLFNKGSIGLSVYNRGDQKPTRVGIIVSLKVSKKAVDRNKIKRMIRESIRRKLDSFKKGYDIVFLTKTSIIDKDSKSVDGNIANLLERGGLVEK